MNTYLENLFSLTGKAVIVTGAARGNGAALSEALLRAGAGVVVADILEEPLAQTVAGFQQAGLRAVARRCDITDAAQLDALVGYAQAQFGRIDVLVNNAGVTFGHDPLTYPDDLWDATYRVNLQAPFRLSRAVAGIMKTQGGGSIINITSLNAELAFPDNPAYAAFKGALKQLTKSLALDLGRYGIRANSIGPGYFRTNMTRKSWEDPEKNKARRDRTVLGRWGQPEDLAGAVIFLASDASAYVTGQDIYVDGGWLIKGL